MVPLPLRSALRLDKPVPDDRLIEAVAATFVASAPPSG
jgi:hypothetical protein